MESKHEATLKRIEAGQKKPSDGAAPMVNARPMGPICMSIRGGFMRPRNRETPTCVCQECGEPLIVERMRGAMLSPAGYPLWHVHGCPACLDALAVEAKRRLAEESETARQARIRKVDSPEGQEALLIPVVHRNAEFEKLEKGDAERIRGWYETRRGILTLIGPRGVGKTYASWAIFRQAYRDGVACEFRGLPELALHLQATATASMIDAEAEIKRLAHYDGILILDDLGIEHPTEYIFGAIYMIVSEREQWERPTVVSTNLDLNGIAHRLDDRIASRLASKLNGCKVIVMSGPDRRLSERART